MTEIEVAYRTLATFMHVHFMGEPKESDLRQLLHDVYQVRAEMNAAIEKAEKALLDDPGKP